MNQIFQELINGRYNGKKFSDCNDVERKLIIGHFLSLTLYLMEIITKGIDSTIQNTKRVIEHDFDAPKQESTDGKAD